MTTDTHDDSERNQPLGLASTDLLGPAPERADIGLLQAAAQAAGLRVVRWDGDGHAFRVLNDHASTFSLWNPLTDDGDALRLAVMLEMDIGQMLTDGCVTVTALGADSDVYAHDVAWGTDPLAATRRAIVLVAADMATDKESLTHG